MQSQSADIKYEVHLILININMYYININLFKLHRKSNWEYLYKIEAHKVTLCFLLHNTSEKNSLDNEIIYYLNIAFPVSVDHTGVTHSGHRK